MDLSFNRLRPAAALLINAKQYLKRYAKRHASFFLQLLANKNIESAEKQKTCGMIGDGEGARVRVNQLF